MRVFAREKIRKTNSLSAKSLHEFSTKAIHVGEEPDLSNSGDVTIPIHMSSTFARKEVTKPSKGYEYSRTSNPTRDALEKRLAAIEDAKFALAFSSGLAAETVLILSLLKKGDHVIAFDDLYGGSRRLFNKVLEKFGLEFTYVDARETKNVEKSIKKNTRMIWIETPTNPLMKICDIRAISKIAKRHRMLTVVDNTFASPYFQKPLKLGADISLHSTTKYINGHADSIGGAIMLNDKEIYELLKFHQNAIGAVSSPFNDFLVIRGIETLALRMERHEKNAKAVAEFLESHRKVKKVYYSGLKSHPQHKLAKRQMSGFSGMISFEIKRGLKEAKRFLESVKLFSLAESLGGVESLIEHPALMTHASIPKNEREKIGISDELMRISVGIEDIDDIIADLRQALNKV